MITKAIISTAGWGTRWLPITKAIEKCMLPIGNRPLVDYIVQDCVKAGITDIYFVVAKDSTQLQQYYSNNDSLNQYLIKNEKNDALKLVTPSNDVTFHYVEQSQSGKYGTAVPVALAAPHIFEGESAVILNGDDFVYENNGTSEVKRLIDAIGDADGGLLATRVPGNEAIKYGLLEISADSKLIRIAEKQASDAPSSLVNIGKYVLNYDAIKHIVDFVGSEQTGEYYITDSINQYVAGGGTLKVVEAQGEYLDGGSVEGWLHANRVVLSDIA